jgi:hypothetical protein
LEDGVASKLLGWILIVIGLLAFLSGLFGFIQAQFGLILPVLQPDLGSGEPRRSLKSWLKLPTSLRAR